METKRNGEVRYASHKFTWKVLSDGLSHFLRRKILEEFFITLRKVALNQLELCLRH